MELAPYQLAVLHGPSGTGKSLLMKALADLIPHEGAVSLQGEEQMVMCPEHWRRQVMYFSAETAWWRETVEAHFEQAPSSELLAQVGLKSDYLQRTINSLSSGEKQRLALLRGLVYHPKVLLLDEITANLDPQTTLQVEQLLRDYLDQHQAAILWVTHDESQQKRLVDEANCWSIEQLYQHSAGEEKSL